MPIIQTRRRFLTTMSLAGAAGLLHMPPAPAVEEALETPTVRLQKVGLCVAPVYIADDSLRAEGFTDVRYVDTSVLGATGPLASGQVDFATLYASQFVRAFDAGEPLTLLAGVMVGCFELFARESIGSVAQLRGKSIGVQGARSPAQELVTLMAAPYPDVWRAHSPRRRGPARGCCSGGSDGTTALGPTAADLRTIKDGPQSGRVEMWRSGCRPNISVAAPFVWRCLTGSTVAPFPHPPGHRRRSPAQPALF